VSTRWSASRPSCPGAASALATVALEPSASRISSHLAARGIGAYRRRVSSQQTERYSRHREPWLTPLRLLSLVGVILGAYAALTMVRALRSILLMLLVSLFLSFAMEPAVQYLGQRGWKRGLATGVVFAGVFITIVAAFAAILPPLIEQIVALVASVPRSLDEVSRLPLLPDLIASPELQIEIAQFSNEFGSEIRNVLLGAAGNFIDIGVSAFGVILQLLTIALVTFYLVADGPRFRQVLARPLPPQRQREMLEIWELAVAKTGGYVYSRLLLAAVCAVLHAVFLLLIGVPYPVPLGLWVGITSAFLPVVGTYLGGFLLLLVAVTNQPLDALWVAVFLIAYQQIENYLLAPRVQARTMDVHPAVAFISVIIGGTLLGAVGALLALPVTAIIQALLSTYVRRHELIAELGEVSLPGEHPVPSRPLSAPEEVRGGVPRGQEIT
jgi:predicted PurR-regulated permease PerM